MYMYIHKYNTNTNTKLPLIDFLVLRPLPEREPSKYNTCIYVNIH